MGVFSKLKDWAKVLGVVVACIGFLKKIMEVIEAAGDVSGAEKKTKVLEAISLLIDKLPWDIEPSIKESALAIIGGLVDIVIAAWNLIGHDWLNKRSENL